MAGLVAPSVEATLSLLKKPVTVLQDSPARLELAESLIALGSARRRHGSRAAAQDSSKRRLNPQLTDVMGNRLGSDPGVPRGTPGHTGQ